MLGDVRAGQNGLTVQKLGYQMCHVQVECQQVL